jgi:hypothetical protein
MSESPFADFVADMSALVGHVIELVRSIEYPPATHPQAIDSVGVRRADIRVHLEMVE